MAIQMNIQDQDGGGQNKQQDQTYTPQSLESASTNHTQIEPHRDPISQELNSEEDLEYEDENQYPTTDNESLDGDIDDEDKLEEQAHANLKTLNESNLQNDLYDDSHDSIFNSVVDFGDAAESKTHDELDDIPSLPQQRDLIRQILAEETPKYEEGTVVNVMPQSWIEQFLDGEFEDYKDARKKLGAIDTSNILSSNGIFVDPNHYPLFVLSRTAFEKLVEWYSLTSRSHFVETHIIKLANPTYKRPQTQEDNDDSTNTEFVLRPEFARPIFTLHHLTETVTRPEYSRYNFGSKNTTIPTFTIPRLFKIESVVEEAIEALELKESFNKHKNEHRDAKFRVWLVPDDPTMNYNIGAEEFLRIPEKKLIKPEFFEMTLVSAGLQSGNLVIEEKVQNGSESYWPSFSFIRNPPIPSDGKIGLQNLGNTCFMNSALQCLVHIPELTNYFLFDSFKKELNVDNPLGMNGKIAETFANLIHNLFDKRSQPLNSYIPRDFKSTIGHFNSMFSGYQQQDSQEFLAFLLDGLHEDLNRIIKKPITEKPELNDKDLITPENIRLLAEKSWEQHKLRNDSIIVDLFTGLYKSTLICPVCHKISITFDPFSDLTLPLPTESTWEGKIFLFLSSGPLKSFDVELPKASTYNTLKQYVATTLDLNPNHLFTGEIYNHQFYNNFESAESQSGFLSISDLISNNDTIVMYEIPHEEDDLIIPVFNTIGRDDGTPQLFGLPFFITLNKEERQSFGTIRRKLEQKYSQLSTHDPFTQLRDNEAEGKKFIKNDFDPRMSSTEDGDNDEGYDSDISLANPDVSGDFAFKVKLWDGSRQSFRQPRRSFRSSHNKLSGGLSSAGSEASEKIWMPKTHNNFTKLQNLLDQVSEKKRAYYTFAGKLAKKNEGEMDIDQDLVKESDDAVQRDLDDALEEIDTIDEPNEESNLNDSRSVEADTEEDDLNNDFKLKQSESSEIQEEENPTADVKVEENDVFEEDDLEIEKRFDLIKSGVALVCEWDYEEFEFLFMGLDESGGDNTWSNPEVIPNPQVEESRRKREASKNNSLTLDECLRLFSKTEVLGEQDFWYCSQCKEHRQASKQIQIWSTPDILSIHLKRFENQRSFSDKIDSVVEFPIEGLDMKSYLASYEGRETIVNEQTNEIYDVFAVDNHYGGLGGGHYTAYVKNFVDNKWYYYDDSRVSPTSPEKAISGAAYLLFYRKRSSKYLGGDKINEMLNEAREAHDHEERDMHVQLRKFYEENRGSSDDERGGDSQEVDDVDIGVLENIHDLDEEPFSSARESVSGAEIPTTGTVETSAVTTVTSGYDSDDVNSISVPMGNSDENHRKLFKLNARSKTTEQFHIQSDIESSAIASPSSNISDDV